MPTLVRPIMTQKNKYASLEEDYEFILSWENSLNQACPFQLSASFEKILAEYQ